MHSVFVVPGFDNRIYIYFTRAIHYFLGLSYKPLCSDLPGLQSSLICIAASSSACSPPRPSALARCSQPLALLLSPFSPLAFYEMQ